MNFAAYSGYTIILDDEYITNPHWFDVARCKWATVYKTTATPCSCSLCKGKRYNRLDYKKETRRLLATNGI